MTLHLLAYVQWLMLLESDSYGESARFLRLQRIEEYLRRRANREE